MTSRHPITSPTHIYTPLRLKVPKELAKNANSKMPSIEILIQLVWAGACVTNMLAGDSDTPDPSPPTEMLATLLVCSKDFAQPFLL